LSSRRTLFGILGVLLFVAVYVFSIVLYVNNGSGRPHVVVRGPSESDATKVIIDADSMKSDSSVLNVNVNVVPAPELLDSTAHTLKDDLSIVVSSAVTSSKHTWQKGTAPDSFRVALAVAGDVANWPFDQYHSGRIVAELLSGSAYTPVPTTVTLVNRLLGWEVTVSPADNSSEIGPYRVELHRSASTVLAGVAILCVLLALATLALFVAVETVWDRRKFQPPMTTWYAAMLFAVMPLRNALPEAPPFGSWIDVTIVMWVVVVLAISMALYISCWWRHTRPEPEKPAVPAQPPAEAPKPPVPVPPAAVAEKPPVPVLPLSHAEKPTAARTLPPISEKPTVAHELPSNADKPTVVHKLPPLPEPPGDVGGPTAGPG
jgi:hypothetical protein